MVQLSCIVYHQTGRHLSNLHCYGLASDVQYMAVCARYFTHLSHQKFELDRVVIVSFTFLDLGFLFVIGNYCIRIFYVIFT
jgi:hypothetical protein